MSTSQKINLGRPELEAFASQDIGFHGLDLSRISIIFIAQILQFQMNRIINTHGIMDEVKYLEGLTASSMAKKPDEFQHPPLRGLKKKHFFDASFLMKNIGAHYGLGRGGNSKLTKVIGSAFKQTHPVTLMTSSA